MKTKTLYTDQLRCFILELSAQFENFLAFDFKTTTGNFYWKAGIGSLEKFNVNDNSFTGLNSFINRNKGKHVFGHLGYDLKNDFEKLESKHPDKIGFADFNFFIPEVVIICKGQEIEIGIDEKASIKTKNIFAELITKLSNNKSFDKAVEKKKGKKVNLQPSTTHAEYIENSNKILNHIKLGDVYELNYCISFYDSNAEINPVAVYQKLAALTEAPMSCFYKQAGNFLMCASPERFLKKEGERLLSQPIKGTIKKGETESENELLRAQLLASDKERAENVMIVDLVRNDLSRIAQKGTVTVDELFGIYSFKTVHQMISTVSCKLKPDVTFAEIIKATFPMGSMTGAPKIRAMQLIEEYENVKRSLFSGSVGCIDPEGDFDFNVVIRSIFYNQPDHYLSTWAGSAITANSIPQQEYEECLLKLQAMHKALDCL